MHCVCIYHYGGPEMLTCTEAPRPRCGPGEVLVQVHAAGVNPVDWKIREGHLKEQLKHTFPLVLGWDVSGAITETGPGTSRLKTGDEVFSRPDLLRDGAYAEFIVIKESEVARKPRTLDHVHAASLPLAGLAAWQALVEAAQLASGQRVLIHAAAGGVGSLAVQLAKTRGAYIVATASARNHDYLRGLGADEIIDYEHVRFEDLAPAMDVVLDTRGGDTQERSWKTLKPGGILVSLVSPPSAKTAANLGLREAFVFVQPNAAQLEMIGGLVDAGKLKSDVETVLPLAEAKRAQALSQGGHTRGKIVLQVV
jgi:NADPH:quinone reductase-like Zn-dependent oxidoreductase